MMMTDTGVLSTMPSQSSCAAGSTVMTANLEPRSIECSEGRGMVKRPFLYFVAKRDIKRGEELLFDYNDTRRGIAAEHQFLAKKR